MTFKKGDIIRVTTNTYGPAWFNVIARVRHNNTDFKFSLTAEILCAPNRDLIPSIGNLGSFAPDEVELAGLSKIEKILYNV